MLQLTPWYGTEPLITIDGPPSAILDPAVRQRRRLAEVVGAFTDDQWAHPSRCEGWSNRDVIVHLESTNTFWCFSIAQGLTGAPTEFLATFDPVASPAALVEAAGQQTVAEVLERFVASTQAFTDLMGSLDDDGWTTLAEAPPGHLSISAVAHHALWDSWVHERDILLPLGVNPDREVDEVTASLRYAAALSPAFAVNNGMGGGGLLAIDVIDPEISFAVEVGDHVSVVSNRNDGAADLTLTGDAVVLLEALSLRAPLDQPVSAESAWMLSGLAEMFDVPPA